jgi:hypothetical protein
MDDGVHARDGRCERVAIRQRSIHGLVGVWDGVAMDEGANVPGVFAEPGDDL